MCIKVYAIIDFLVTIFFLNVVPIVQCILFICYPLKASSFLLNTLSFPSLGPSPAPRQTGPAYQHTPGCVASVLSRSSGLGSTVYSSTSGDSTIRDSTGMPTGNDTTLPSNRLATTCGKGPGGITKGGVIKGE